LIDLKSYFKIDSSKSRKIIGGCDQLNQLVFRVCRHFDNLAGQGLNDGRMAGYENGFEVGVLLQDGRYPFSDGRKWFPITGFAGRPFAAEPDHLFVGKDDDCGVLLPYHIAALRGESGKKWSSAIVLLLFLKIVTNYHEWAVSQSKNYSKLGWVLLLFNVSYQSSHHRNT
jgi:hypothetical protein